MSEHAAADLAVPPVDTDGRELRLSVTPTDHVAVATRVVALEGALADAAVHLEVLAASHRVRLVCNGVTHVTETVACDAASAAADQLPTRSSWNAGGRAVSFTSKIVEGAAEVSAAVESIAELDPDRSIVVRFPGHSMAFTAIELLPAAADDSIAWQTWHLYPGPDAHVVLTSTTATHCVASPDLSSLGQLNSERALVPAGVS